MKIRLANDWWTRTEIWGTEPVTKGNSVTVSTQWEPSSHILCIMLNVFLVAEGLQCPRCCLSPGLVLVFRLDLKVKAPLWVQSSWWIPAASLLFADDVALFGIGFCDRYDYQKTVDYSFCVEPQKIPQVQIPLGPDHEWSRTWWPVV